MIAQFRPTRRLAVIASTILVLTLVCFTFTRAAEKAPAPQTAEKPKLEPTPEKQRINAQRGIKMLEGEFAVADARVREKQKELDALKLELNISSPEEAAKEGQGVLDSDTWRKMESQRIEAAARYAELNALYTALRGLSRADFRNAVQTAAPDPHLASLMEKLTEAQLKLANSISDYSEKHPEITRLRDVIKMLEKAIEVRLDGILVGLKVRAESSKAGMDTVQKEMHELKRTDIKMAITRRPYFDAKHDLESLKLNRERIALRIIQEKIDAAIQKANEP